MHTSTNAIAMRCFPSLLSCAREAEQPWAARAFGVDAPPDTLAKARARRDDLARLLRRERGAAADFLLALADFDRRRGWEQLGHAGLFPFLVRELGLSKGAAHLRLSAARLLPRHRAVEAALRDGRLCLSAIGQLARVLTPTNEAEVLPRFFGRSAREAQELVAELLPSSSPPARTVVTPVPAPARSVLRSEPAPRSTPPPILALPAPQLAPASTGAPGVPAAMPGRVQTSELAAVLPVRPLAPAVQPLTADLRRLHLTVSRDFLEKVEAARIGLSHAMPHATIEHVLEAALGALLERQARRKGLVKRPRCGTSTSTPTPTPTSASASASASASTQVSAPRSRRPHIPAAIAREVRLRDGGRCQFPLDAGGLCGSTWQVELDHIEPVSRGGPTTAPNLRCACRAHNQYAAEHALGGARMASARKRGTRPGA